jgi:hypothetical protein
MEIARPGVRVPSRIRSSERPGGCSDASVASLQESSAGHLHHGDRSRHCITGWCANIAIAAALRQSLDPAGPDGLHRECCSRRRESLLPWALLSVHDQRSRRRRHRRLEARSKPAGLSACLSLGSGRRLRAGPRQLGPGQSVRRPALAAERQGRRPATECKAAGPDAGSRSRCRPYSADALIPARRPPQSSRPLALIYMRQPTLDNVRFGLLCMRFATPS